MHEGQAGSARIVGLGTAVPQGVLDNAQLERLVDTSDEWILARTGIRERRMVSADESVATLAIEAGRRAMADAGVAPEDVDLMILATATPEQPIPSTATIIQPALGLVNATCFDIAAACSGFLYALRIARQFIVAGEVRNAMVIGAETLTRYTDFTDRSTCILFGDGAGAAILQAGRAGEGILESAWHSDGTFADFIQMPGGGSRFPPNVKEHIDARLPFIKMRGNETFKVAVRSLTEVCQEVLHKAGVSTDRLKLFVPHQANLRIIAAVGERLGLTDQQVYVNLERYGNTSSASIPLALREAIDKGLLQRGDLVLMAAFGGGLTWAASLVRW
ncbi:MAG: beta-ketoacyl-ACP synthase III [Acidobacteriota bacterium]